MPELQIILSPTVTLVIGACVVFISFRQWRLAKDKFRLDLFEKRYKVYEAALIYLSAAVAHANVRDEDLHNYNRGTMDAVFLFGPEVNDYLKVLRRRTVELQRYQEILAPLPVGSKERSARTQQHTDELNWLRACY